MIRLTNQIEFTFDIQPACLHNDTSDENSDVPLLVTGWGINEANELSNELLKTQVSTLVLPECNETLLEWNRLPNIAALRNGISGSQYCAFDPNARNDSCQGDSGGPLQVYRGTSSIPHVVGVVSFGKISFEISYFLTTAVLDQNVSK